MWFRREQRNRRLNHWRVLDVKLRSSQVRAARTRLAVIMLGVTFGTVAGLYLLWRTGEWALDRFIYKNSEFAIQRINVQTDGIISLDQLRRWSGAKLGENLIALDLSSIKRNLELVPTVDSVSVERILPRTLRIRVTERQPVVQVNVPCAGATGGIKVSVFQLDADGYVMQPLDPRLCVVPLSKVGGQLPVIVGLNMYELQPGHRVESPQVQAALKLMAAFDHSPMSGFVDLRRIDVSSPGVIVATTGQGSMITFGLDNPDQQLRRWRKVYDLGQSMNRIIVTLDLAVSNNVPVRWMETTVPPVTVPKSANPAHVRRKNV